MAQLFDLINAGHVKPIQPIKTFKFEEIPAAMAFMRTGRHIGKIVISNGEDRNIQVEVRKFARTISLKPDVSYLIVGGLKGLCGSLAIHLAHQGAKHIVAMSRSGLNDDRSAGIIRDCKSLGCEVHEAKGDVVNFDDVLKAMQNAPQQVAGIIQGAMVLRVSRKVPLHLVLQ